MDSLTQHQKKDIRVISRFIEVYCSGRHPESPRGRCDLPAALGSRTLCPACEAFLKYVITKRLKCPLEAEKPSCKRCRIHCYASEERKLVKEIMAYSGRKMILRGRLDYLWHYLF